MAKKKEKESKIDSKIKKNLPFLAWIGILIIVFIISYYFFQGLGKIDYEGLTFQKERFGEIDVYTYDYVVKTDSGAIMSRKLYLRNDPRYNEVNVVGDIIYPARRPVYLSLNSTGLKECDNSTIALATLTGFLINNGLEVRAGTPDKEEAKEKNQLYVACDNYEGALVMDIKAGDKTEIRKGDFFCYEVSIANCEILEAFEKFIVQSLIDSRD